MKSTNTTPDTKKRACYSFWSPGRTKTREHWQQHSYRKVCDSASYLHAAHVSCSIYIHIYTWYVARTHPLYPVPRLPELLGVANIAIVRSSRFQTFSLEVPEALGRCCRRRLSWLCCIIRLYAFCRVWFFSAPFLRSLATTWP